MMLMYNVLYTPIFPAARLIQCLPDQNTPLPPTSLLFCFLLITRLQIGHLSLFSELSQLLGQAYTFILQKQAEN